MEVLIEIKEKAEKLEKRSVKTEKLCSFLKEFEKVTVITPIIHDGKKALLLIEIEGDFVELLKKWEKHVNYDRS
ncbi:MAG: hypothetical protein DSY32_04855 [Aquifex sp.]|nr:MAG: hypothetical protein DSY32_04855 [Aquifex sp.]